MKVLSTIKSRSTQSLDTLHYLWEVFKCFSYILKENLNDAIKFLRRPVLAYTLFFISHYYCNSLLNSSLFRKLWFFLVFLIMGIDSIKAQPSECIPMPVYTSIDYFTAVDSLINDTIWFDVFIYNNMTSDPLTDVHVLIPQSYPGLALDSTIQEINPCSLVALPLYFIAGPYDFSVNIEVNAQLSTALGDFDQANSSSVNYNYIGSNELNLSLVSTLNNQAEFGQIQYVTLNLVNPLSSPYTISDVEIDVYSFPQIYSSQLPIISSSNIQAGNQENFFYSFYPNGMSTILHEVLKSDIIGLYLPDGTAFPYYKKISSSYTTYSPDIYHSMSISTDLNAINVGDTIHGTLTIINNQAVVDIDSMALYFPHYQNQYSENVQTDNFSTLLVDPASSPLGIGDTLNHAFWFIPYATNSSTSFWIRTRFKDSEGKLAYKNSLETIYHQKVSDSELTLDIENSIVCLGESYIIEEGYLVNSGNSSLTDISFFYDECLGGNCTQTLVEYPDILAPGDTVSIVGCEFLPYLIGSINIDPKLQATPISASTNLPLEDLEYIQKFSSPSPNVDAEPDLFLSVGDLDFGPSLDSTLVYTAQIELSMINTGCLSLFNIFMNSNYVPGILDFDTVSYQLSLFEIGDTATFTIPVNLPEWNDPIYLDDAFMSAFGISPVFTDIYSGGVDTSVLSYVTFTFNISGHAEYILPGPYFCPGPLPLISLCNGCRCCLNPPCLSDPNLFFFSENLSAGGGGPGAGGGGGGSGPLPVELISFSGMAQENYNLLEWTTASEIENDYFTLYKSLDGTIFEKLSTVFGTGNTNSPSSYFYNDDHSEGGIVYYRLEQTDFDGRIENLGIVALERNEEAFAIEIYPVPARDQINLTDLPEETEHVHLLSVSGQIIKSIDKAFSHINISDLSPGIYFLKVETEDESVVKKFIKE